MGIIKATTIWMCFASIIIGTFVKSLENGLCNYEFCTCQMVLSPEDEDPGCPDWFVLNYDTTETSSCLPSDLEGLDVTGLVTCLGYKDSFFLNYQNSSVSMESASTSDDNETVTCFVSSWLISDGDSPVVVNYTESNPPPECSIEVPFTLEPTSAPAIPTPAPSSSAASQLGLWAPLLAWIAAAIGVKAVSGLLPFVI
jgi:hypothetical protein